MEGDIQHILLFQSVNMNLVVYLERRYGRRIQEQHV